MANFGAFGPNQGSAVMSLARRARSSGNGLLGAPYYRSVALGTDGVLNLGKVSNSRILAGVAGTVSSFGKGRNLIKFVKWNAVQTITRNAVTLETPTQANITTSVGATAVAMSDEFGNWVIFAYSNTGVGLFAGNSLSELIATGSTARANIGASPLDPIAELNDVVNPAMEVSLENGTTGVVLTAVGSQSVKYTVDGVFAAYRGSFVATIAQVTDAPPGFNNSIKMTVGTAQAAMTSNDYMLLVMPIEGMRISNAGFGAAGAASVSFGVMVKAHRTGNYSAVILNGAVQGGATRSYGVTFAVNVADTWELKTFTIPGDVTGTWNKTNGTGLYFGVVIASGSGFTGAAGAWFAGSLTGVTGTTNGVAATTDTFQITGAVIIPRIDLTQFDQTQLSARWPSLMRPADQEDFVCRRYFHWSGGVGRAVGAAAVGSQRFIMAAGGGTDILIHFFYPRPMRNTPTIVPYDDAGTANRIFLETGASAGNNYAGYTVQQANELGFGMYSPGSSNGFRFDFKADVRLA